MKKHRKSKLASIVFILTLIMTPLIIIVSTTSAQPDLEIDTFAYLAVVPNVIGIGQQVRVTMWLDKMPPSDVPGGDDPLGKLRFQNFTLKITKPDGTTTEMGPYQSDYIASAYLLYTPNQAGEYTFQFIFPGNMLTGVRSGGQPVSTDYYNPSSSPEVRVTVQQEPVSDWPPVELPTDFWDRPINEENREWHILGGSWLGMDMQFGSGYNATGAFNPYTKAPNTPHIVWTKFQHFAGIAGGPTAVGFYTGLSYEERWQPPNVAVINGRLYYGLPLSNDGDDGGMICVDIRTGEEYWRQEGIYMDTAQVLEFHSMNQHGIIPFLWDLGGGVWEMYDAVTGELVCNLVNASSGNKYTVDASGNLIAYRASGGNLMMWNSTKAINPNDSPSWRPPIGGEVNWPDGIEWEVPLKDGGTGQSFFTPLISSEVICSTRGYPDEWPPKLQVLGYNAKTGEFMWSFNLTNQMIQRTGYNFSPIMDGVFCWFDQAAMQWYGYDAQTGRLKWGPTEPYESSWGVYSQTYRGAGHIWCQVAYGKLYATGYDGTVHCYDLQTGNNDWNFVCESSGFETPYGVHPFYGGVAIADGKLYVSNNEHSPNSPNWRGGQLYCLNAMTGDEIWRISGWMLGPVIADGYMAVLNSYDGQIYGFGKGKTATTVTVQDDVIPLGDSVLIKGTVTDQSPGAIDTPAIADEYMSEWMEYLYMQKPMPMSVTGVEVILETLDPNGNYNEIGRVTSDASGMYKMMWEPPVEGEYTIVASFTGSESYWRSNAETAIGVTGEIGAGAAGPPGPQGPQGEPGADADAGNLTLIAVGAIIVALIAIALAAYVFMKKRS
jgi:outer membrane protein assembly factor BamB